MGVKWTGGVRGKSGGYEPCEWEAGRDEVWQKWDEADGMKFGGCLCEERGCGW